MNLQYNLSSFYYKRIPTIEVKVKDIGIGGNNPIRIQSMITSDTQDVASSVKQVLDLERAGCELVRITVPSMKDAESLVEIRQKLKQENSKVPIVADIHFTPSVALFVVDYVDKVRINPGNFVDKKKFEVKEYTDSEYKLEIERIADAFIPLLKKCKEKGVAIRIGTNHGSLSDRIMNRYGDTPEGMCESALEFIRIAESESFKDIVVSMKSSNPLVMVQAYRLLSAKFLQNKMSYPFHLGVTEAGNGNDGRIKSSIGIATLLEDGIGDTIRVSLTEDAIYEIPAAQRIAKKYNQIQSGKIKLKDTHQNFSEFRDLIHYKRILSNSVSIGEVKIGESFLIRIETDITPYKKNLKEILNLVCHNADMTATNQSRDLEILHLKIENQQELKNILEFKEKHNIQIPLSVTIPDSLLNDFINHPDELFKLEKINLSSSILSFSDEPALSTLLEDLEEVDITIEFQVTPQDIEKHKVREILNFIKEYKLIHCVFSIKGNDNLLDYRKLASQLQKEKYPILLSAEYNNMEELLFEGSAIMGGLLLDGIGDCMRLTGPGSCREILDISYDILQACRLRTTKTEFISCPSCGRTQFNLQETTARIKARTSHLKGVKIAIMGCIVNGPGEMADADFGYVGAGPDKVHLYKGKEIIKKNVPSGIADEELISLIKQNYMWVDP